jgi:hypothetical protein
VGPRNEARSEFPDSLSTTLVNKGCGAWLFGDC